MQMAGQPSRPRHAHSLSETVNHRAQLARAYQELGKELSSTKIRLLGNYTLGKVIGEGTYGKVRIGTHRMTSTRVAIKQIPKDLSAQLTREIHHHRRLHHPYVTQLYEVIATENSIWLVTELCSGGELFDYLVEKGRLSEEETKRIFGQLCLAMHYVHESGCVHRDLKLENVLLDDRCNVKIGDFGFTREFESGRFLDTFCGTTGYAAPEMLLGQKYSGPEVDIWSLGIILHCLLTGQLPFDDDDEDVMKAKIVAGIYEDYEWLSDNARDLVRKILKTSPSERISIPSILNHPWFSEEEPLLPSPPPLDLNAANAALSKSISQSADAAVDVPPAQSVDVAAAVSEALGEKVPFERPEASESSSTTSDAHNSAASDGHTDLTSITTPDVHSSPELPVLALEETASILDARGVSRSGSQSTLGPKKDALRTQPASKLSLASKKSDSTAFAAVAEIAEEGEDETRLPPVLSRTSSLKGKASAPPSAFPTRTPARTKRRSVSSTNISAPTSPTEPSFPAGAGAAPTEPHDYATLLTATAPLLFSTPLERGLLTSLSTLGFDTGQIVHSVLTDACDSTGALWWLLKKKAERREVAEARRIAEERRKTLEALDDPAKRKSVLGMSAIGDTSLESMFDNRPSSMEVPIPSTDGRYSPLGRPPIPSPLPLLLQEARKTPVDEKPLPPIAPHISFVPPTPSTDATMMDGPQTPPHIHSSSATSTATLGAELDGSLRSVGSTPSTPGTPKEKRSGKSRSGSVSMLQRAAGLVRKKSEERVKDKEATDDGHDTPTSSGKLSWGRSSASEPGHGHLSQQSTPTNSPALPPASNGHGHGHIPTLSHSISFPGGNKLTKSPPAGKGKEREVDFQRRVTSALTPESPWTAVSAPSTSAQVAQQPSASRQVFKLTPPFLSTHVEDKPTESFGSENDIDDGSGSRGRAQRASIFNAFRLWFQEDKKKTKGKGKAVPSSLNNAYASGTLSSPTPRSRTGVKPKKRNGAAFGHGKRPSVSSRRSSSVNSRRSSVNSIPPPTRRPSDFMLPQPLSPESMHHMSRTRSDASRRSMGSRTPSSEVGSRPSSIRSFNRTPRARPVRPGSPSQASTGSSRTRQATASPMFHRRLGSGSSSRVVRQVHVTHHRNNSQASSTRSSRHNSFDLAASSPENVHELGERFSSLERSSTPSRERSKPMTVFVAHKQNNVFGGPSARNATISRSSWKKSWGVEPPSWQSRTAQAQALMETLSDPGHGASIRDVFTGRQSLDPDDEDEWVDEDDEIPAFAGGLGQLPAILIPGAAPNLTSTSGLPPSPSLRSKHELPPLMGGKSLAVPSKRHRPTSAPAPQKTLHVDHGASRTAGLRTSPTPPLLPLASETLPTLSEHHPSGSRVAWRPMQGGRSGANPAPIQEEDEDEE